MLEQRTLLDHGGIQVGDTACRHRAGRGHTVEVADGHALVFVRRGCFVRAADGAESLLDATVAFCRLPGQEVRYDHPGDGGDDCTVIALNPEAVASLWGGRTELPGRPLPTVPAIDLQQRLLLASARRGADAHELYERAIGLSAGLLETHDPRAVASGRPTTRRERAAAVDAVRELLAADPGRPLPQLARQASLSPHHLSRTFRAATGHTIARHRMLLRARLALERLAGGERNLARLAAELGFADQSHLTRVVRALTGRTPATLRAALADE